MEVGNSPENFVIIYQTTRSYFQEDSLNILHGGNLTFRILYLCPPFNRLHALRDRDSLARYLETAP
jgi:hypothetical protein